MEHRVNPPVPAVLPPVPAVRAAALAFVGVVAAVLAVGAARLVGHLVAVEWDRGEPVAAGGSATFERDLLAFGTALPSFAVVAAICVMFGLTRLRARERWEGTVTVVALGCTSVLGLLTAV